MCLHAHVPPNYSRTRVHEFFSLGTPNQITPQVNHSPSQGDPRGYRSTNRLNGVGLWWWSPRTLRKVVPALPLQLWPITTPLAKYGSVYVKKKKHGHLFTRKINRS